MPEKFNPRQGKSGGKSLILALVILLLVVIISGGYFAYDYIQKGQNNNIVQNNNTITPTTPEVTTPTPPVQPVITPPVVVETTTTPVSTVPIVDTTTTTTIPVTPPSLPVVPLVPPVISSDADNDGLTDLEEGVIGTSPTQPDTDADGYTDGQEINNGFNPLSAGSTESTKLPYAVFVTTSTTNFTANNFNFLYPKDWSVNIVAASSQAIITTKTGEIIKITAKENPAGVSAANWFLQQNPTVALSQLKIVTYGFMTGVMSPNTLQVYLTNTENTKLYTFEYLIDPGSQFRYPALFSMIIKSLKFVEAAPLPDLNAGNNIPDGSGMTP